MSLGTVGDEGRPDDSIGLTILELTSKFGVHPRLRRGQTAKRKRRTECLGRRIEGGGKISLESRTNTDSVSSILPSYESPLLLPFFASSGLILLRFHSSPLVNRPVNRFLFALLRLYLAPFGHYPSLTLSRYLMIYNLRKAPFFSPIGNLHYPCS